MADIAVDKAYLVALFLETLFYGIFAVLLAFCMDILITKRRGRIPWKIVFPPVIMFLLSSVHVSIVLRRNIEGFIDRASTPGGAAKYFMEVSNPLNVTNQFIYAINNIIGDSVVIWRCYVVWDHNWKMVVAPVLLLIATTVTSLNAAYQFSQATQGVFTPALAIWGKAFFCTTLVTNLLVTSLIATRIWWVARKLAQESAKQQTRKQRYWSLLFLVVESGMIYSTFLLVELILYASQTNAVYILFDCTAQVTGIVPTLIIVLVGLGMTKDMTTVLGTQASIHFRHSPGLRLSLHETTFEPQTVSVAEFQGTDIDRPSDSKTLDMYPLAESSSASTRNPAKDKKEEYKPWRDHRRAKDKEVG